MIPLLHDFWKDESGQGLSEYGLLVAAVVVMAIVVTATFSGPVIDLFVAMGAYISGSQAST